MTYEAKPSFDIDVVYFPLCCLDYSKDFKYTCDMLIAYGIVLYAHHLQNNFELCDTDENMIYQYSERHFDTLEYDTENDLHQWVVFAGLRLRKDLKIWKHSIRLMIENFDRINSFVAIYENKHGRDAKCKIKYDYLIDCISGKLDEKLLRTYCAIASVQGIKSFPPRITYETLRYRMHGYKKPELFTKNKCKGKLLSRGQINRLVAKLEARGLLNTYTYKKRLKYYSVKHNKETFMEVVVSMLNTKEARREARKERDLIIQQKLDEARAQRQRERIERGSTFNPEMKIVGA